jgi:hypothetical protein
MSILGHRFILYTYYNLQESNWEGQLKGDWENTILPHAEKLGAKTIGTIGELLFSQIMYAKHHLCITDIYARLSRIKAQEGCMTERNFDHFMPHHVFIIKPFVNCTKSQNP